MLGLMGGLAGEQAAAKLVQEVIKLSITARATSGQDLKADMVVTLLLDDATPQPRPMVVIGHDRAVEAEDRAALGRVAFSRNARWFARLGFVVAVPTRAGYGITGGLDVEDFGRYFWNNTPPPRCCAAVAADVGADAPAA